MNVTKVGEFYLRGKTGLAKIVLIKGEIPKGDGIDLHPILQSRQYKLEFLLSSLCMSLREINKGASYFRFTD